MATHKALHVFMADRTKRAEQKKQFHYTQSKRRCQSNTLLPAERPLRNCPKCLDGVTNCPPKAFVGTFEVDALKKLSNLQKLAKTSLLNVEKVMGI